MTCRVSRDGVPFLFHDASLTRMTGERDAIEMLDAARIDQLRLPDGCPVTRLSALLALCPPDWPLLLEIKGDAGAITRKCVVLTQELTARKRPATAVMSFYPTVGRWFARHRPDIVRGLVVTQQGKAKTRARLENALALWLARPDFLACDIRDLPTPLSLQARAKATPVLTWTVRSDGDRRAASAHADQIIFEQSHD